MAGGTREAVISAAAALLDSGGQGAVTLRAVAERVGVSHNAPYRHFDDRSALLGAVAERDFRYLKAVFEAEGRPDQQAGTALRNACKKLVAYARRHPARYRLLFSDPGLPDDPALKAAAFASFLAFSAIVAMAQAAGVAPSAERVSLSGLIYAAVHGAIDLELGGRASEAKGLSSVDGTIDLLFDLLGS